MYKDTDLAYIAAFIDTDGCITFSYGRKTKAGYRIMCPTIIFYNFDLNVLTWIQSIFGGKIYNKPRFEKHSIARQLFLRNQYEEIYECIKNVMPFMKIKKKQAEFLIEFLESRLNRGWKPNKRLAPSDREQYLAKSVREMNQKRFIKNQT